MLESKVNHKTTTLHSDSVLLISKAVTTQSSLMVTERSRSTKYIIQQNQNQQPKKMKLILFTALTAITMSLTTAPKGIHQFKVKDIDGKVFDFASLKGKKVLIVNTASECGFTKQYAGLEKVYEKYKSKNFVIIGFPCNDFGGQEPGTEAEVKLFCSKNFGVTFPLMSKVSVKGPTIAPIYKWLTEKAQNGVESSSVKWNFQKYMIDENGNYVNYLLSVRDPDCDKIVNWIEGKK